MIEVVENGFVVREARRDHVNGKSWAFETPDALADFIRKWGEDGSNELAK